MKIKKIKDLEKIKIKLSHRELMFIQAALRIVNKNDLISTDINFNLFDDNEIETTEEIREILNKILNTIETRLDNDQCYPF